MNSTGRIRCVGWAMKVAGGVLFWLAVSSPWFARAVEPLTLDNVVDPGPNQSDEPFREGYSEQHAARFLDAAALSWQKDRKCFTCHTNYAYLYARPKISSDNPAHRAVRQFAEQLVTHRWPEKGPRWDAEVVATAAALAYNDAATSGRLHAATRAALDRMWTLQREDGGWNWLKCQWPPMEYDDHYGATLAAIAVGVAPGGYAQAEPATAGLARLRAYLSANPTENPHQRAMLLWANSYLTDLVGPEDKQAWVAELLSLQKEDGGWASATLGAWKRQDGTAQDTATSDGYGTGFVVFVLRRAGVDKHDAGVQRGMAWLKAHQRESGRWYARSLFRDGRHYLTHAGSAFAVMALAE